MRRVEVFALEGIPEIRPGDHLGRTIEEALRQNGPALEAGDVVVVSQKVVSKAEGCVVRADEVRPSPFARALASGTTKSSEHVEIILRNTARVVRMDRARGLFIMETPHGFVCANAGVDRSNVAEEEAYTTLPDDPDASARRLRAHLEGAFRVPLAVVVTDTFGRPWRTGQVEFAIGVAGMRPLRDLAGTQDPHGYTLQGTLLAVADEVAAAAGLVKGKVDRIPVAVVRGVGYEAAEGQVGDLIRDPAEDLFR